MIVRRAVAKAFAALRCNAPAILLLSICCACFSPLSAQDVSDTVDHLPGITDQAIDQTAAVFPPLYSLSFLNQTPGVPTMPPGEINRWYRAHSTNKWIRLRGRLDTDFLMTSQNAASVATYGEVPDQAGFRRARIGAEGNPTDYLRYVAEIDLATGNVIVRDSYFALGKLKETGEYRFGHMREPFSLEGGTSANSFAFMERSLINTLDPARNWGVAFASCGDQEHWTFAGGIFQSGTDASDLKYGAGSTTAVTSRWTGLAWYEDHGRSLMHFGLAISERIPDNSVIYVTQLPQTSLLSFDDSTDSPFVPKLKISANFQELINLQWAYVKGSFWSQAEWYGTFINQLNGEPVFYHGSYLDVGYFLTGEQRNYLTTSGVFGAVSVKHPVIPEFSSKPHEDELGFGAWEAVARIGYLDFVSGNGPLGPQGQSTGVFVPQVTLGMNWYLADRMRMMFNYTYVLPDEVNTGTSAASVLGMRLGIFW